LIPPIKVHGSFGVSSQAERSTVVSVGRPTCRPPGAWDECAASTLSRRPGRLRAPGLLPVARTRARNSPAGQRDPTAPRGRAARHHRLRIENWISSLKPGWLSQCLAEFRRRKLFEDRAKLRAASFPKMLSKTALRRCPTRTGPSTQNLRYRQLQNCHSRILSCQASALLRGCEIAVGGVSDA
jgi:hypothetical protein